MTTPFRDSADAATAAMRTVFAKTPLMRNALLSAKYDADVWLKREDLSPVRSYKLRGAFNAMRKMIPALSLIHISEPTRHICLSRMPSSA